jgi:hypothetical protein
MRGPGRGRDRSLSAAGVREGGDHDAMLAADRARTAVPERRLSYPKAQFAAASGRAGPPRAGPGQGTRARIQRKP